MTKSDETTDKGWFDVKIYTTKERWDGRRPNDSLGGITALADAKTYADSTEFANHYQITVTAYGDHPDFETGEVVYKRFPKEVFTIKHGSIASVTQVNGVQFIYFNDQQPPGHNEPGDAKWRALPHEVQKIVSERFATVFNLPVDERAKAIKSLSTVEIEATATAQPKVAPRVKP